MPRSRSRSRSHRRDFGRGGDRKEGVAEAAKSGSSEQEIVSVAIRQLPTDIRERLEKLFEEGLLREGDLDLRSITVFASLNEGLQARVMNHMEGERIYVANARSKSGFLIATCDKAKTGCLDARGLGAIDPWRTALVAMATPKLKLIDLKSERDWLEKRDEGAVIKIKVNLGSSVENELGVPDVTVELPLTECSAAIKAKLTAMGVKSVPANKMKLHNESVGFLKESRTFAYYNLDDGSVCTLSERKRAGTRFRADHTVMPKRPKAQTVPPPGDAKMPADAPGMPALPKLPGLLGAAGTAPSGLAGLAGPPLPGLPGLPKFPGAPGAGLLGLAGLPGLGGFGGTSPGLGLPKLGGLPGLAGSGPGASIPGIGDPKAMAAMLGDLGNLGKAGAKAPLGLTLPCLDLAKGLPGLPPPGSDPKAAALAAMGRLGGLPGLSMSMPSPGALGKMPGFPGLPDLSRGIPGLPPPGSDPKAAAMAMMAKMGGAMPGLGNVGVPGGPLGKAQIPTGGPPGLGGFMGSSAKAGSPA